MERTTRIEDKGKNPSAIEIMQKKLYVRKLKDKMIPL